MPTPSIKSVQNKEEDLRRVWFEVEFHVSKLHQLYVELFKHSEKLKKDWEGMYTDDTLQHNIHEIFYSHVTGLQHSNESIAQAFKTILETNPEIKKSLVKIFDVVNAVTPNK